MAPSLEARFLLCSFLPGIPVFFIFYCYFPFRFEQISLVAVSGAFIFLFGILIDVIRHGIEELPKLFFRRTSYDVWEPFTSSEINNRNEAYFNYLSSRHYGAYHMWEFTGNFSLSIVIILTIASIKDTIEMSNLIGISYRMFWRVYDQSFLKDILSFLIVLAILLVFLNLLISFSWKRIISRSINIRRDVNFLFHMLMVSWWIIVSYLVSRGYQLFFWSN